MLFRLKSATAALCMTAAFALALPAWVNAAEETTGNAPAAAAPDKPVDAEAQAKRMKNARVGFGNNCGRCHENFGLHAGPGPKLAGIKLNKEQVVTTIANGRNAMPSFKKTLTPEQIDMYADYILSLKDAE